jgi:polar amino acid transport system substrate-binding protein
MVRAAVAGTLVSAGVPGARAQDARHELAPSGTLRVGAYLGSPLSMVLDPATGEPHGLCVDLGRLLAQRLDVPFEVVGYRRIADVVEAMQSGSVDFTITNASAARAQVLAFGPTIVSLELGFLVPTDSAITAAADIDALGVRVGVTEGSTSQVTLAPLLKNASVVPAPNLTVARGMLARHELDAFATNKAILYQMSDEIAGARILDGRWGVEHIAAAIPKGHEGALEYLRRFVDEARASGAIAQASERAGVRGTVTEP